MTKNLRTVFNVISFRFTPPKLSKAEAVFLVVCDPSINEPRAT